MIAFTVIDGKVIKMECFSVTGDCREYTDGLVVMDFINYYSRELSIKDLYFIMYDKDEVHFETVREEMTPYEYKKQMHQIAYDHTCELVLQLPAFRMSIDLGDSMLEHNHFLIPDSYMLYGFRP